MCARLDRRFRGGRTAAEATHARLLAFWRWPEHRDLFEPLRAWERRHALPLIVYGLTVGIIHKGPIGAPSLHELAIAIPYSLGADLAIICAWWLWRRTDARSGRRVSMFLCSISMRVDSRPHSWRWRHKWFFGIWAVLTSLVLIALTLATYPWSSDEQLWDLTSGAVAAILLTPLVALPVCFLGWLSQIAIWLYVKRTLIEYDVRPRRQGLAKGR
jgi:hypothetical protein